MPVRWTPEMVSAIFLTHLQVQDVKINYDAIINGWPTNLEKPTKKALSEQIAKMKKGGKAYPPSTPRKTPGSGTSTPRSRTSGVSKGHSSTKKRQSTQRITSSDSDSDEDSAPTRRGVPFDEARALNAEAKGFLGQDPFVLDSKNGLTIDTDMANRRVKSESVVGTPRSARAASQKASAAIKNESDVIDVDDSSEEEQKSKLEELMSDDGESVYADAEGEI